MPIATHLLSGAAGATAMTLSFFALEKFASDVPHFDKIGMHGVAKMYRTVGARPPRGDALRRQALGADLVSNTMYFARAMGPDASLVRGALAGLAAGIGTVAFAPSLGSSRRDRGRTMRGKLMTVAIYTIGGMVSSAVGKLANASAKRLAD